MRIFRFDLGLGQPVDRFGSLYANGCRIVQISGEALVNCIYLGASGILGNHPAVNNQLFLVMQGWGWMRGESGEAIPVVAGQAASWKADEEHETRTEGGLVAIVIESKDLDPVSFMVGIRSESPAIS